MLVSAAITKVVLSCNWLPELANNCTWNSPLCFLGIQTQINLLRWCLCILLLSLVRTITLPCVLNLSLNFTLPQAYSLLIIGSFTVAITIRNTLSIYIGWLLFSQIFPDYCIVWRAMEWVPKQMSHAPLQGPVVTRWTGSHSISNHSPRDDSTLSSLLGLLPLERFHLGKHRNKLIFIQSINAADKSTHHVNIIFHWALYCKPSEIRRDPEPSHIPSTM